MKSTDIQVNAACWATEQIHYRAPMKFGGRVVTEVTLLHVEVEVVTRDGRRASGRGSMPMGNVWSWPSNLVPAEATLAAIVALGQRYVDSAPVLAPLGDPLQITSALAAQLPQLAREVTDAQQLAEPMPRLAQLVAASPLEAAIHDAFGRAWHENSYRLLSAEYINQDLGHWLGPEFAGEYLDQYTRPTPVPSLPIYHLVGALDPLTPGDLATRLNDGLPETLGEWIHADQLTHLKIKLNGDNLDWDVQRVMDVDRVAAEAQHSRGCHQWYYSLDFNERCANVDYVLDFLRRVQSERPAAWPRIQYVEQPTHRDLRANPENRMHRAAALKPVVIDESLIDLDSLLLSREMGYSGVALKACKGHTEALLMGAAAQKYQLFLCVQDLTCPGASFLHSASLASRVPGVAAIEGNARQYCPAGNRWWRDVYPEMFHVRDGALQTRVLDEIGLGFHWPADHGQPPRT